MKLLIIATIALGSVSLLAGCASVQQQQAATMGGVQGAAVGAAVGAHNNNTLGGAVVGGIIGATTAAVMSAPNTSAPFYLQPAPQGD